MDFTLLRCHIQINEKHYRYHLLHLTECNREAGL
jgi:hypothetical protein